MSSTTHKKRLRTRRHKRIRAKVSGTSTRPRVSVFRSNTGVYVQLIDDENGVTLASASSHGKKDKTPLERSRAAGTEVAKQAKEQKITKAVFDRGGYNYAGLVRAVAEGARDGGLQF